MDNTIYNALVSYYNALEKKGYMSYASMAKVLILIFYRDLVYGDYKGLIKKQDYRLIERALDCLYGSTCLIPYPVYTRISKLNLGEITEMAERIKVLENAEVYKPLSENSESSDILIVEDTSKEE